MSRVKLFYNEERSIDGNGGKNLMTHAKSFGSFKTALRAQ